MTDTNAEAIKAVRRAQADMQRVLALLDADARTLRQEGVKRSADYTVGRHLLGAVAADLNQAVHWLPPITPISSGGES